MIDLEAIELIKQLKARYFRFLDTGDFANMRTVFSENPKAHFNSPSYDFELEGWQALEEFYRQSFTPTKFGMHTGHHPEITVDGDTAEGIWYLHDIFYSVDDKMIVEGSALYRDKYIKENGEWKMIYTGYERLFEVVKPLPDDVHIAACPVKPQ